MGSKREQHSKVPQEEVEHNDAEEVTAQEVQIVHSGRMRGRGYHHSGAVQMRKQEVRAPQAHNLQRIHDAVQVQDGKRGCASTGEKARRSRPS